MMKSGSKPETKYFGNRLYKRNSNCTQRVKYKHKCTRDMAKKGELVQKLKKEVQK